MKKIALLGIAAATVLAVGIFANIGLFGNNALAAEPTTEQRIKTMFWMITNKEFGLKEIKNEVRAIEEKLDNLVLPDLGILEEIKDEVDAIELKLDDPATGLAEIKAEIIDIDGNITSPDFGLEEIKREVRNIEGNVTSPDFGLEEIKAEVRAIEEDLLQKKAFYEVEDVVTFDLASSSVIQAVLVQLVNCDDAIPLEKRAFNIETLGVRISDTINALTTLQFDDVVIDKNFLIQKDLQEVKDDFGIVFIEQIGASDQVEYVYFPSFFSGDDTNGISLKAVAVGQMPQGCEITVDADAPITIAEVFEPFPGPV